MQNAILIAALLLTNTAIDSTVQHHCRGIGQLAESIMEYRQDLIPMGMLQAATANSDTFEAKLTRYLITEAYMRPVYAAEEDQRLAIQDFRDDVEAACYYAGYETAPNGSE